MGTTAASTVARSTGRTLADDAPEVVLSSITNECTTGLTPAVAAGTRRAEFPQVVAVST